MGYCAGPGEVHVYFKPAIATADWQLVDLVSNKDRVRQRFLEWHHEHR